MRCIRCHAAETATGFRRCSACIEAVAQKKRDRIARDAAVQGMRKSRGSGLPHGPKPMMIDEWAREQMGLPLRFPDNTEWACSIPGCHTRAISAGICKDWYCEAHRAFGESVLAKERLAR